MGRWLAILAALTLWLALAGPAQAVTLAVTKTADTNDDTCDADCSLREAIDESNDNGTGDDDVVIPAGTYNLTGGQLPAITGDLDIDGAGAAATQVVQTGPSRVFQITNAGLPVTFAEVTVHGGNVSGLGGGILHDTGSGSLTITDSFVQHNRATTAGATSNGGGGGIFSDGASLTITRSTVRHNTASATGSGGSNGGGGVHSTTGLTIDESVIYENVATVSGSISGGGGLWSDTSTETLRNSTFSGNSVSASGLTAGGGGGYFNSGGGGTLNNLTFANNSAGGLAGGGINDAGGVITVSNTILANNSAASGSNCSGISAPFSDNLESADTCGLALGELRNTDPKLGGLENNGGPTLTHRLLPGSPAINAGGNNFSCEPIDQRGGDRPSSAADAQCDIGAFEFEGLAQVDVPPCSRSGQLPFTMVSPPGSGVEGVNYKIDGGPQLQVPLPGGESGTGSILVPEGRRQLEYWGDSFPTGDQEGVELIHHFPQVVVDRTNPNVAVRNPNRFKVFVVKRRINVNVSANDSISGLTADPSGAKRLSTTTRGAKTFAPAAIDLCANQATAPFDYRVLAPRLGTRTVIEELSGRVGVVPRRSSSAQAQSSQKGQRFRAIREPRELAIGSFVDTRRGTARITSSSNRGAGLKSSRFVGGIFQVLESRARRAKAVTELRLKGGRFSRCRRVGRGKGASVSRLSRRTIRRLSARARGRFRTRGRHSAATVRGTTFTVSDRCDGTLTTVKRGRVAVRDFRRKKTVIVRAGKRYLARAPG